MKKANIKFYISIIVLLIITILIIGCNGNVDLKQFSINTSIEGEITKIPDQSIYNKYSKVEIEAVPDEGWNFFRWEGSISDKENPIKIVVDEEQNIIAVFVNIDVDVNAKMAGKIINTNLNNAEGNWAYYDEDYSIKIYVEEVDNNNNIISRRYTYIGGRTSRLGYSLNMANRMLEEKGGSEREVYVFLEANENNFTAAIREINDESTNLFQSMFSISHEEINSKITEVINNSDDIIYGTTVVLN